MTGTTEELPLVEHVEDGEGGNGTDDFEEVIVHRKRLMTPVTWGLLFALGVTLAFFGGVRLEKSQASSSVSTGAGGGSGGGRGNGTTTTGAGAAASSAAAANGGAAGGGAGGNGAAGGNGGATFGQVKLVDGTNVYVQDQQGNVVKVSTPPGMVVTVSKPGTVADLKPGDTVVVRGQAGSDGTVAATSMSTANGVGGGGFGAGGRGTRNGGQGSANQAGQNQARSGG